MHSSPSKLWLAEPVPCILLPTSIFFVCDVILITLNSFPPACDNSFTDSKLAQHILVQSALDYYPTIPPTPERRTEINMVSTRLGKRARPVADLEPEIPAKRQRRSKAIEIAENEENQAPEWSARVPEREACKPSRGKWP